ncbi:MAG: ribosome recycling factor [Myxococcales bacterium]|nr:ribosome recycling factor [Myxococcales bacterium]MDH5566329.1 ribosome recycling factor [Myxococcales bacterium]
MAEQDAALIHEEAKGAMEKSLRSLRAELQKIRTGRANTALLDGIQVDYYGTPTPLNQLANLGTPDPRLIVVSPYDKGAMGSIEKAILASDLGLTPSNDGKVVRIPIPPLTEERRKELVKHVHRLAEDHKVGVREGRRDALSLLKDLETEGTIPVDDRHREEKRIQGLTDEYIKKIDEMTAQKEEEILQV